ncbi:hypothetical protein C942_04382 [Photobacterium marinum]|uniref:Uncharacterized protein n=3 Tax=Photobacterium TaxID=657 RepID=L8JGQ3_9GAMM|nr:hypothetical protein C942_04382 [Photobacterium marinum]
MSWLKASFIGCGWKVLPDLVREEKMFRKISELDFFKLFGLIGIYFLSSYLVYLFITWFGHGDDLLYLLVFASLVVTALLFLALFRIRKRKIGK